MADSQTSSSCPNPSGDVPAAENPASSSSSIRPAFTKYTLIPQTISSPFTLEYSVHSCPPLLKRELIKIFPEIDLSNVLILPTFQPMSVDLLEFTEETEREKNRGLDVFMKWAKLFAEKLRAQGHWADYTDPVTGYPVHTARGGMLYSDVDGIEHLLHYRMDAVGCCRVASHPKWRTAVYPATAFTSAPLEAVRTVLDEIDALPVLQ